MVTSDTVAYKWGALCLPPGGLDPLLSLLGGPKFHWLRFLAIAAGSISASLTQTMILICELLTEDPEGGKAAVPVGKLRGFEIQRNWEAILLLGLLSLSKIKILLCVLSLYYIHNNCPSEVSKLNCKSVSPFDVAGKYLLFY